MYKQVIFSILLLGFFTCSFAQDDDEESKQDKRPSWSSGLPERQSAKDLNKPEFKPEIDNEIELDMSEFGIKPKTEIDIGLPIENDLPSGKAEPTESEKSTVDIEPEPVVEETAIAPPLETIQDTVVDESSVDEQPIVEEQGTFDDTAGQTEIDDSVVDDSVVQEPVVQEPVVQEPVVQEPVVQEPVVQEPEAIELQSDSYPQETIQQVNKETATENNSPDSTTDESGVASEVILNDYVWKISKQTPVKYPVKAAIDNLEGWVDVEITINAAGEVISASPVKYSRRGRIFGKAAIQSVNDWLFNPPRDSGFNSPQTRVIRIEFEL